MTQPSETRTDSAGNTCAISETARSHILVGDAQFALLPAAPSNVTTLPQLFHYRATRLPNGIAFSVQTDNGPKRVTYSEANAAAERLSSVLASLRQDTPGDEATVVAIWLEKGLDLVLSLLTVTYSGATWLPLDPDVPVERAAACLLDASVSVIISDSAHASRVRELQERIVAAGKQPLRFRTYGDLSIEAQSIKAAKRPCGPRPRDAAYIIYTSGTTGTPKGIAISHSAALAFAISEQLVLGTGPNDIVWNGFSPAFDMFVEEMWVTVAGGGHLAIGTREECRDVPGLPAIWESRGVTLVNAVPTLIGIMEVAQSETGRPLIPASIRLINLGGEPFPPALVNRLARPGLRILNTYGPTETTVTATWVDVHPGDTITIGKPLPGYHACLLPVTEDGTPTSTEPLKVCPGAEGELAIGGPCVGLGYVGRPELTTSKFIPHPLFPGERIYRTGDRVSLQPDLSILYHGRIDTQVKHRGFRIELGEIEARVYDVPSVQAAAVILANPGSNNARLEAFVVVRPDAVCEDSYIQRACHGLPAYMRPEHIWYLEADEMPRLASGKINLKALQDVSDRKTAAAAAAAAARSPHPSSDDESFTTEASDSDGLLGVFLTTLSSVFPNATHLRSHMDLFDDLGLHSLTAAMLVSRLRNAQSDTYKSPPFAAISLGDIYEGRTPARIAARFSPLKQVDSFHSGSTETLSDRPGTGPETGDFLPVTNTRFVLCGIAQLPVLLWIFFLLSLSLLVPYLVFDSHATHTGVAAAVLATYAVFVAVPPFLALVAVAAKWALLGRVRPGEHPLYGTYYFRWWVVDRLTALVNGKLYADSALYPHFLRMMGARVGACCHIGTVEVGPCADLLEIGDDVTIGADVDLAVSVVERGRLILKRVVIGDGAVIGANCVIEGGAVVGPGAEIATLSSVMDGMVVPASERWHGSPASLERRVVDDGEASLVACRPSRARAAAMCLGNVLVATFVLPLLYFVPQIPGLLLFDSYAIRGLDGWAQVAVMATPVAILYTLLVLLQLVVLRKTVLGRVREGTYGLYSAWYLRKWLVERLMDLAMDVLHPVYATLYIVPFLRLLGVKIGDRAEVSTARGLQFELLEIGEESFVADAVLMGDVDIKRNRLTLKKTTLRSRSFAGNASILPQGTVLASGALVGVLSIAPPPTTPLATNASCFGSPPVLMPLREQTRGRRGSELLFRPSAARRAARLAVEAARIVLPRAVIVFGLGFAVQACNAGYGRVGAARTLLCLPLLYGALFALPALLVTALLKWALVGRYAPAAWPLWSPRVWLSEAVTSTWESLAEPLLAAHLVGTPLLAVCFRLMGVRVGSRVTLLSSDITEHDVVRIGDEALVNHRCGAQTHLFEDRVMKIGPVTLGRRACLKPRSICLPGSSVGDGAQLGSLSLLMKGESLQAGTAWEGAPITARVRRRRAESVAAETVGEEKMVV